MFYLQLAQVWDTNTQKLKISTANSGRKHSKETIAKLVAARVGKNSPMTGQKHSQKTRQKMSVSKQGKNHPMFGKQRALGAFSINSSFRSFNKRQNSI